MFATLPAWIMVMAGASIAGQATLNVSWSFGDAEPPILGYRIEVSTDGVTFRLAGTVSAIANSFQITGLAYLTLHYVRVIPYNVLGDGAYTQSSQTTAPAPGTSQPLTLASTALLSRSDITLADINYTP